MPQNFCRNIRKFLLMARQQKNQRVLHVGTFGEEEKLLQAGINIEIHSRAVTLTVNLNIICELCCRHHFYGSNDIEKMLFLF